MSQKEADGGIGFFGLLGIVFIILKLTKVINWSWWLVTLPLWGGFAFMGLVIIFLLIITVLVSR